MHVLVVDDSKPIYMMVNQMLEALGHTGDWAENGQLAVDKLKAGEKYDLVLLDWNMPVLDGMEFLMAVKNESLCECPVVMMTTENKPEKIEEALSKGAVDYIMKPFTTDILENKMEMVLG
jgi:two-component system, chemotaxis family, chemotaxis protein CheY